MENENFVEYFYERVGVNILIKLQLRDVNVKSMCQN